MGISDKNFHRFFCNTDFFLIVITSVNLSNITSLMKSTQVQTPGTGHALVYTENLVGSVASYNREELNMSFTVCVVTASKESY